MTEPTLFHGVMVSSTFTDLQEHREKLIEAILRFGLMPVAMEHHGARADLDVLQGSLRMVGKAAAYVGVIGLRYGQIPDCPDQNPNFVSISELEFDEAMRLQRPILLFIMDRKHLVSADDVETDPDKIKKLDAFRKRAKIMREGSKVHRVYEAFDSVGDFAERAAIAIGKLREHLPASAPAATVAPPPDPAPTATRPPALAHFPEYLGSHDFVGRAAELRTLDAWCAPTDPRPMLLFQTIGGTGKSMLTWEWLTNHAPTARADWAGRLWYSFYEQGAEMSGFCRQALAYMTAAKPDELAKLPMARLADLLLEQLKQKPWLLVLDGLERVLVAYHRSDAAQLRDDEVELSADQIGARDPCAAIRSEDDALLRRLAAAAPSKLLVSSRLTPLALVNRAGQPVPGVRREMLPGLLPADAEAMLRAAGIQGTSRRMQAFLQANCDCHPLVIGALAGLINTAVRGRGDFDRWEHDHQGGGALDLAKLDLRQKQTHILTAAIDALPAEARQLLRTLALLQGGADAATLEAFNPHLPPPPVEVKQPDDPEAGRRRRFMDEAARAAAKARHAEQLRERAAYLAAKSAWERDPRVRDAPARLQATVRDLEQRGLLQYDRNGERFDLHPVVRGIAAGGMAADDRQSLGQRVVDHFDSRPHDPWERAETLRDLAPGLQVVRTLLDMGQHERALRAYLGDLSYALVFNVAGRAEAAALLRRFFPHGWDGEPAGSDAADRAYLLNDAAFLLRPTDPARSWRLLERALRLDLGRRDGPAVRVGLGNLANDAWAANRLRDCARLHALAAELADAVADPEQRFRAKLESFTLAVVLGDRAAADLLWGELDKLGRGWSRAAYRPGDAEFWRATDLFQRGALTEAALAQAEALARDGRNRATIQHLHSLRGEFHAARREFAPAATSFDAALRMAREAGQDDADAEAQAARARLRAGGPREEARDVADRLAALDQPPKLALAELWQALDEPARATPLALRAHERYVADGEPYVRRYELDRTRALLQALGAALPAVKPFDPASETRYAWEAEVRALIEAIRAKRAAKQDA